MPHDTKMGFTGVAKIPMAKEIQATKQWKAKIIASSRVEFLCL
jgi:alpha-D-ribose 1-methylphosphonate 5-triphosphate synthase subunit PhnG